MSCLGNLGNQLSIIFLIALQAVLCFFLKKNHPFSKCYQVTVWCTCGTLRWCRRKLECDILKAMWTSFLLLIICFMLTICLIWIFSFQREELFSHMLRLLTFLIDLEFSLKHCKVVYIIFINELLQFSVTNFHNNFFPWAQNPSSLALLHCFLFFISFLLEEFVLTIWLRKQTLKPGLQMDLQRTLETHESHSCSGIVPLLSIKAISECGGGLLFPLSLWAAPAPLPVYQLQDLLWVLTVLMRILKSSRSSALRAHEPEETYPERWTKGRLYICGDTYNTLQEISGGLLGRRIYVSPLTQKEVSNAIATIYVIISQNHVTVPWAVPVISWLWWFIPFLQTVFTFS